MAFPYTPTGLHIRSYHFKLNNTKADIADLSNLTLPNYRLQKLRITDNENAEYFIPSEVIFFGSDDPNSEIYINQLIQDIILKTQLQKMKENLKREEIYLYIAISKENDFKQSAPRKITHEIFMDNFSCYKLDTDVTIDFFSKCLGGEELPFWLVKTIFMMMSLPFSSEYNNCGLRLIVEQRKQREKLEISKRKIKELLKKYFRKRRSNEKNKEKLKADLANEKKLHKFLVRRSQRILLTTNCLKKPQTGILTDRDKLEDGAFKRALSMNPNGLGDPIEGSNSRGEIHQKNRVKNLRKNKRKSKVNLTDTTSHKDSALNTQNDVENEDEYHYLPKFITLGSNDTIPETDDAHIDLKGIPKQPEKNPQLFTCSDHCSATKFSGLQTGKFASQLNFALRQPLRRCSDSIFVQNSLSKLRGLQIEKIKSAHKRENSAHSLEALEEEGRMINEMYAKLMKEKEEAMKMNNRNENEGDKSFSCESVESIEESGLPSRRMRRRMGIMLENKQKDEAIKFIRMQLTPVELKNLPEINNVLADFLSEKDFPQLYKTCFSKKFKFTPFDYQTTEVRKKIEENLNNTFKINKKPNTSQIKIRVTDATKKPEIVDFKEKYKRKLSLEEDCDSDTKSIFSGAPLNEEKKTDRKSRNANKTTFNTTQPKKKKFKVNFDLLEKRSSLSSREIQERRYCILRAKAFHVI